MCIRDRLRLYGELISANIYQLKRGMKTAQLLNYYTGEQASIPLDVSLSPSANAAKYFKRANKLKNGLAIAQKQAAQYQKELAYLQELEYGAEAAQDLADLQEVRAELVRYGYLTLEPREKLTRSDPQMCIRDRHSIRLFLLGKIGKAVQRIFDSMLVPMRQ